MRSAVDSLMRLFNWLLSFSTSDLLEFFSPTCTSAASPVPFVLPDTTTLPPKNARVAAPEESTSMPPPLWPVTLLPVTVQFRTLTPVFSMKMPPPLDRCELIVFLETSTLRMVMGNAQNRPPPRVSLSVATTELPETTPPPTSSPSYWSAVSSWPRKHSPELAKLMPPPRV